jgi:hypothetical protein
MLLVSTDRATTLKWYKLYKKLAVCFYLKLYHLGTSYQYQRLEIDTCVLQWNFGYKVEDVNNLPENLINLSSPIIISSIKSQWPSLIKSGASNVEQISPPKI